MSMMPMAGQAYQIVNKTLETGGRGSVTTSTDYSGISDAFMKKAALHTQIAGQLMDYTSQKASTLSNLELAKADIHMHAADMAQRESFFNREMKAKEDADKMSPFEQITGVLAGAAQGAIGGAAVGGKPGAIVGGVVGGLGALGAGNSRTRQSNTISNIGTISNAAVALKGMSNTKKAQDSSAEMIKGVGSVAGIFRQAPPGSEEFQGAEKQLDNYLSQYGQSQIQAGRPMGEVHKEMAAIKKEAMGGFDPNDTEMVANRKIAARIAEAKADPAFMRGDRDAVRSLIADTSAYHIEGYGKSPTKGMAQVWVTQADPGIAENYYKGLSSMPATTSTAAPAGKTSTNTGATGYTTNAGGGSASGVSTDVTGRTGGGTTGNTPPLRSQDGTATPNYVMQGAGASAGPVGGWGMEPDSGPQQVLMAAQTSFNKAAAQDPSIIDKALHRSTPGEPHPIHKEYGTTFGEGGKEYVINADGTVAEAKSFGEKLKGIDDAAGRLSTGIHNTVDKFTSGIKENAKNAGRAVVSAPTLRAEDHAGNTTQTPVAQKVQAQTEAPAAAPAEGGVIKPNIISTDPVQAQKEQKFKTATNSADLIQEFDLQGRYPDKATADAVMAPVMATTEMNRLREYINQPEVQQALREMTPTQRAKWDNYVRGLGEQAMQGNSKGVAGSAFGASAQVNWSEFERSIDIENKGKGEHGGLSKKGLTALNRIKTKMTPAARTIGMAFNSGTLTNQDVSWVPESMVNMFDQDPETATAGFSDLQDSVWNMFTLRHGTYMSGDQLNAHKAAGRAPKAPKATEDDEVLLYP